MHPRIVISGGTSGIGAAVARRLLTSGCELWSLDRVESTIPGIHHVHCDLADPESIDVAVRQLPSGLDGVINVAGISPTGHSPEAIVAVNFLGMRQLIERTIPGVADDGAVVIVASSAGRDWRDNEHQVSAMLDTPDFAAGLQWLRRHDTDWQDLAYKFSKQCAAAYTYRAAGLARVRRVRVNCINPGITETPLAPDFREMLGADQFDRILKQSGRAGSPDEVAAIAEFLLTGDCSWLNGVELTVDGGYYAGLVGGWITD